MSTVGDVLNTVGNVLNIVGNVQFRGEHHNACEGYHESWGDTIFCYDIPPRY